MLAENILMMAMNTLVAIESVSPQPDKDLGLFMLRLRIERIIQELSMSEAYLN